MEILNKIGQGHFTKCYNTSKPQTVYLDSRDPVKECMAHGWFPNSRYFPKVSFYKGGYTMRKYTPLSKLRGSAKEVLKGSHYNLYCELKRHLSGKMGYCTIKDQLFNIKNRAAREAIDSALSGLTNYGEDICFEISPRNVAVTKSGCLILLDCFFIHSHLRW